jgi:hypothetical protein
MSHFLKLFSRYPALLQPIQVIPVVLTMAMVLGIFIHDSTIDKATLVALPLAAATIGATLGMSEEQHTHVEEVSVSHTLHQFSSAQPRIAKRNDDNDGNRHKKGLPLDDNSEYHWPSI